VPDVNPHRLELAERTGATAPVDVSETRLEDSGLEADALIECSGHPASLKAGVSALRPAGAAVLVGMGPEEEGTVPLALIQSRELWLTGTFRYANTYPTAIALAAHGRVDLEAIITGHYGLDDADAALRAGREDPTAVKVMVTPERATTS
jgi:L-iditol 2-dehydrogenase